MLLAQYPSQRRRVTYLQISAPSREEVPEYLHMRQQVEAMSGRRPSIPICSNRSKKNGHGASVA
jgi:trehalose-6-phosphate synthase